ncbi:MAG: polysaccharide export protein [Candidatus Contendobacter sp.]|nr:polysaccharide export protein [Candidatus Contendobacter sp.]
MPAVLGPPPSDNRGLNTYLIGPHDLLSVRVFKVAELSTDERVSEEGTIVLPLVGPMVVAGLTPHQAQHRIAEALTQDLMHNPQVSLFVKEYANRNVSVGGAVKKPGIFPITGAMTLLKAVAEAEGLTEVANPSEVIIFRGAPGQSVTAYVIDLEQVQSGAIADPQLISYDRVMIPESGSAVFLRTLSNTLRGFVRPL